ncbi:MAG: hypothetical protein IJB55_03730 [Firmicutes bacterium]|nr:hypothetical protein [Bacillota bacterium]
MLNNGTLLFFCPKVDMVYITQIDAPEQGNKKICPKTAMIFAGRLLSARRLKAIGYIYKNYMYNYARASVGARHTAR